MTTISRIIENSASWLANLADQTALMIENTTGLDPIMLTAVIGVTVALLPRLPRFASMIYNKTTNPKLALKKTRELPFAIIILAVTAGFLEYYKFAFGIETFRQYITYRAVQAILFWQVVEWVIEKGKNIWSR